MTMAQHTKSSTKVVSASLGFPRIGADRELKKAVEAYWAGKSSEQQLQQSAAQLRLKHWQIQKNAHVDRIASNDFSFYDQVLDWTVSIGAIPERYQRFRSQLSPLDLYFAMARGRQDNAGVDVTAMEMKKWYDTNYHFIVPELTSDQSFTLEEDPKSVREYIEAKNLGFETEPVLLGPVTYLLLSKIVGSSHLDSQTFDRLVNSLLPVYRQVIEKLVAQGATSIRFDEGHLVVDLPLFIKAAFNQIYHRLLTPFAGKSSFTVATYFGELRENLDILISLPHISVIHVDVTRDHQILSAVTAKLQTAAFQHLSLSAGIIDARNIWANNLDATIEQLKPVVSALGPNRVIVSTSASMLHVPHSLERETVALKAIKPWLAFATEKLNELCLLSSLLSKGESQLDAEEAAALKGNRLAIHERRSSPLVRNPDVQLVLQKLSDADFKRTSAYSIRSVKQQAKLNLPLFPTTTIGSFPQTAEVRSVRAQFRSGKITRQQYSHFIQDEIKNCVKLQEELGLDVLVHGEFERTDMVEAFGELLEGYKFSQFGWVQSYGSRCVKPPIIFGDVSRPNPMTVEWTMFAASQTSRPMKAMLTGPITCLQWSFARDDQPREDTCFQLAAALRNEVADLEKAGISVIQVDEPAIREGLPLRRSDWDAYLKWAVNSFRLTTSCVNDETQIHTHMCYSDFNEIMGSVLALDADVTTIENARSDAKLLRAFQEFNYSNGIGPGLYDIHSARVPSIQEMYARSKELLQYINKRQLWVNPDCGLKTRGWPEVKGALHNLVEVAKLLRSEFA